MSWPAYGHLLPMVPLIRAAERAGHDVLVSSGADLRPVIEGMGLTAHESGLTLAQTYAAVPGEAAIGSLPQNEQVLAAARHFFGAGAVARAGGLREIVGSWRPDLIVHDITELGSAAAAVEAGVPHVTHGYGPTVPGTSTLARVIGETLAAAGFLDPVPAVLAAPYLDPCPPGLPHNEPIPWGDVRAIRPSAGEIPAGAKLPPEFGGLPHDATIYVTLGTITNQAPDVFRAVIDGLRQHRVNAVLTTGPDQDPAVLGDLPDFALAVPFLPQALLLPQCRAVISHTGAGTMFGALCQGLPQLCLPQGTDQPANAASVVASGAGVRLEPDEIDATAVAAAVDRLHPAGAVAAAARELAARISVMPAADAVMVGLRS